MTDSILDKLLPGLAVAIVTQFFIIIRGYLEEEKRRKFLRADLKAEVEESLRIIDLFVNSTRDDLPESSTSLGPGLAILMAPIQCQEEYLRLVTAIKSSLPVLTSDEFKLACDLKQNLRSIAGYTEACDRYLKKLLEIRLNRNLNPDINDDLVGANFEIFRLFGLDSKAIIDSNASIAKANGMQLIEKLTECSISAVFGKSMRSLKAILKSCFNALFPAKIGRKKVEIHSTDCD
ncbi:hypothetical protein [Synechococcus elongatus]|uniref:Uncharacterized protein n=1 Tax=Synechococcus elongatus PCC 11801 TaxID=2219813 RepID=A0AAQ3MDS1_SYNEL|nr:hypothetical protein [Synechococcus elongatus]